MISTGSRRQTLGLILTASFLIFGFIWGFICHKERIFPFHIARFIAMNLGVSTGERFQRKVIESRFRETHSLLEALGYVEGMYDPDHVYRGVVNIDRERVFDGYRFYDSPAAKQAFLIDVLGDVIHEWRFDTIEEWQSATLMPNGDVLVIVKDYEILKIDRGSNLIWRKILGVHHDLDVYQDEVYVLTRQPSRRDSPFLSASILEERVSILSDSGKLVRDISLFELIWNSEYRFLLTSTQAIDLSKSEILDVLHSNHVEVFDGSHSHLNPIFSDGNILVCIRNIDVVMIFDPKLEKIVFIWGPNNLTFPHHPTVLDNGNILIFDNGVEMSRVVEIDPISGNIEWSYTDNDFFSATRGSAQRVANGNTLVTESDTGYVFEVTSAGEEVWRFANPDVQADGTRYAIWRMTVFERDESSFLRGLTKGDTQE